MIVLELSVVNPVESAGEYLSGIVSAVVLSRKARFGVPSKSGEPSLDEDDIKFEGGKMAACGLGSRLKAEPPVNPPIWSGAYCGPANTRYAEQNNNVVAVETEDIILEAEEKCSMKREAKMNRFSASVLD